MRALLLAAGPDFGNIIGMVVKLVIVLLLVGLFYWIINHPKIPLPDMLRTALNVILVVVAVLGVIVWLLVPFAS